MDAVNLEENSPLVSGLASIQADLFAERQKLIVELGLDGGLAEQKGLAAAAKVASKRGKVKNAEKPTAPLVARRSLRVQNIGPEGDTNPDKPTPAWAPYVPLSEERTHPSGHVSLLDYVHKDYNKEVAETIVKSLCITQNTGMYPSGPLNFAALLGVRGIVGGGEKGERPDDDSSPPPPPSEQPPHSSPKSRRPSLKFSDATSPPLPKKSSTPPQAEITELPKPKSTKSSFMSNWLVSSKAALPLSKASEAQASKNKTAGAQEAPPHLKGNVQEVVRPGAKSRGEDDESTETATASTRNFSSYVRGPPLPPLPPTPHSGDKAAPVPQRDDDDSSLIITLPTSKSSVGGGGCGCSIASGGNFSDRAGYTGGSGILSSALTHPAAVIKALPGASSNRVYSLVFHPSPSKLIICAGGRFGQLALWAPASEVYRQGQGGGGPLGERDDMDAIRKAGGGGGGGGGGGKRNRGEGEEEDSPEGGEQEREEAEEDNSTRELAVFSHHSEVISAIAIPSAASNFIYTASLDCSVRCLDAERGVSWELVSEDEGKPAALCLEGGSDDDCASAGHSMWVGNREGQIYHLDSRVAPVSRVGCHEGRQTSYLQVHVAGKKITTLSLGGSTFSTLLSAGGDGAVKLWDVRKMPTSGKRAWGKVGQCEAACLAVLTHGTTVCSAYFSPRGTYIMSSSNDDLLRVWRTVDVLGGKGGGGGGGLKGKPEALPSHVWKHDMHTGRWLTPIKAPWDPAHDSVFLVGDMTRKIKVMDASSGKILKEFSSELLTAVPTQTAIHPNPLVHAMVGGTASGRLYLWT